MKNKENHGKNNKILYSLKLVKCSSVCYVVLGEIVWRVTARLGKTCGFQFLQKLNFVVAVRKTASAKPLGGSPEPSLWS